jgi:neopullulanase
MHSFPRFSQKGLFIALFGVACLLSHNVLGQSKGNQPFTHVEPPNWWLGMKNSEVQVLFHNASVDISKYTASINYPGVSVKAVKTTENPHYLFVTLDISPTATAGNVPIVFTAGKNKITYSYPMLAKSKETNRIQGFNSSDVLYLIMPDRFANGDPKNDSIAGMYEGVHRNKGESRHGGDIKGISDHLDYIKELGVTTIWFNPVLENNQKRSSYHGYAITDLYNVDRRFGGNAEYLSFIKKSHDNGLKVVQDMVMNHIGNDHWLMHDLPEKTWVNQWPEFTRSNYQGNVISDPYQSTFDANKMSNGWFDTSMPDVNQTNALFATYLIQNSLWWIEYSGIDGIRMDTHPYPDKDFMSRWAKTVMEEYPSFNVVGEVWINAIPNTAYWQKGMKNKDGYESNLPTVTDFPFCFSVPQAFNEPGGWDTGMRRLYTLLSQDFLYPNPNNNLTFLDNHDMTRIFLSLGKDIKKLKMALTFMLTTRGIPQLYYGTELLMDGDGGYHPNIRLDVPGGWPGDNVNAFSASGRSAEQNQIFDYMKKLLQWRKGEDVIHNGKLTHYIPEENVYIYFRHNASKTVMVVINASAETRKIDTARLKSNLGQKQTGTDVITGTVVDLSGFDVPGLTSLVLELR